MCNWWGRVGGGEGSQRRNLLAHEAVDGGFELSRTEQQRDPCVQLCKSHADQRFNALISCLKGERAKRFRDLGLVVAERQHDCGSPEAGATGCNEQVFARGLCRGRGTDGAITRFVMEGGRCSGRWDISTAAFAAKASKGLMRMLVLPRRPTSLLLLLLLLLLPPPLLRKQRYGSAAAGNQVPDVTKSSCRV